jgi:prefoldin subunit 5
MAQILKEGESVNAQMLLIDE